MDDPSTAAANARLALRRLVAGLIAEDDGYAPPPSESTLDELLAQLDTDESADFALVLDTLTDLASTGRDRPRFILVRGFDHPTGPGPLYVVDTEAAAPDPFGVRMAQVLGQAAGTESGRVAVRHLNKRPDLYDEARNEQLTDDEPF